MLYPLLVLFFFGTAFLYFRVAKKYGILDVPNHRSAHQRLTIRGIGLLFPVAVLAYFLLSGFQYPYFVLGLCFVGVVSFIDDVRPLANRYRIAVQFISVGLLLFELFLYHSFIGLAVTILLLIVSVGIMNAYNFMDGINGMTGLYSLLLIAFLYYINCNLIEFMDGQLMLSLGLSLGVFLFYNFRKKAVGFCGDVGSVSIAFVLIFCLGMLMLKTDDLKYIFLLSVYGVDTIYTLLYRLQKKENIFEAHKCHFYQILVHEYKYSHLIVSLHYGIVQFALNLWILKFEMITIFFYLPFISLIIFLHKVRQQKGLALRKFFNTK
jgi:UDP-GlcNAc:undecaprenyl-phosphate GlcNAc-1-phosphate transferase